MHRKHGMRAPAGGLQLTEQVVELRERRKHVVRGLAPRRCEREIRVALEVLLPRAQLRELPRVPVTQPGQFSAWTGNEATRELFVSFEGISVFPHIFPSWRAGGSLACDDGL